MLFNTYKKALSSCMTSRDVCVDCVYILYTNAPSAVIQEPLVSDTAADIFSSINSTQGIGRLSDIRQCAVTDSGAVTVVAATNATSEFFGIPFNGGVSIYAAILCIKGPNKEADTLIAYTPIPKVDGAYIVKPATSDVMLNVTFNWGD